jgi:hypothetical protein
MNKYPEKYKQIKDYDYEVSNYGNVRNKTLKNILKPMVVKMRLSVKLYKEIEGEKFKRCDPHYVNELVCKYFLNQYNGEYI